MKVAWTTEDSRRLREARVARGLCAQCGQREHRPDLRTCQDCADLNQARKRQSRLNGRPRRKITCRCIVCNRKGHSIRTCKTALAPADNGECLRCRDPPLPGKAHCGEHERILAQLAKEGWVEEL